MLYERTRLAQEVVAISNSILEKSRGEQRAVGESPDLQDADLRQNIKLAECPSHGESIFDYAPNCPGAKDYLSLAHEVLVGSPAEVPTVTSSRVRVNDDGTVETLSRETTAIM